MSADLERTESEVWFAANRGIDEDPPAAHVAATGALVASFGDDLPEVNAYPMPEGMPYQLDAAAFAERPVSDFAAARRRKIHALQLALTAIPGSDVGPEPLHLFSNGMYFRQLTLPAGVVIVSKRHAREHLVSISKGSATVFTEDGVTLVIGPYAFVSPAGSKRVLLVHEEIVWANVHRTDRTTVEDVERDVIMDEMLLLKAEG